MDGDGEPSAFVLRAVVVGPGCRRAYDEDEWEDAIVVVKRGQIELESVSGISLRFCRGDLLWLAGLPLRAIHNRGGEPALLVAMSRR